MSTAIKKEDYAFEVVQVPVYIKIPDPENPDKVLDVPVKILGNRRLAVIRTDRNVVMDIVSEEYEEANHESVVTIVKNDLLPRLGWNILEEKLNMWMEGAIMDYCFVTESSFKIGDTTLFATIHAINSHNRFSKAGVRIMMQDNIGTSYMVDSAPRTMYSVDSLLHRRGALELANLQKIADRIPLVVNRTVDQWKHWNAQMVSGDRIRFISQLFNLRLAEYIVEAFPSGTSRFNLYKGICQFAANGDKMSESGFNVLSSMSRVVKLMSNNILFSGTDSEIKEFVKEHKKMDWEEVEEKKEERRRRIDERKAAKAAGRDIIASEPPSGVEAIVEIPEIEVPVGVVEETDDRLIKDLL